LIVFIVVEITVSGTDGGMAHIGAMKKNLVGFWVDPRSEQHSHMLLQEFEGGVICVLYK
jgi:hypothetical protein